MLRVEEKKIKTAGWLGIVGTMKSGAEAPGAKRKANDKRGRSVMSNYRQVL